MTTIETHTIWPYNFILRKLVYRSTRYMCIILVPNIIWRSGQAIRSSSPLDFSSLHFSFRGVCSQFSTWQLCYTSLLAARLWGRFLAAKSYFQRTKKWTSRTRQARGRLFLILNTAVNQKIQKNFRVIGTLKREQVSWPVSQFLPVKPALQLHKKLPGIFRHVA